MTMLKKYGIGLLAIFVAVASVAFTTPLKKSPKVDMYVFEFDNTKTYSVANVQNISNSFWIYKGKNLALCDGHNAKACRVAVTASYVDNATTPTALANGLTITASTAGATLAYVSAITTTNQFSNQRDQ